MEKLTPYPIFDPSFSFQHLKTRNRQKCNKRRIEEAIKKVSRYRENWSFWTTFIFFLSQSLTWILGIQIKDNKNVANWTIIRMFIVF